MRRHSVESTESAAVRDFNAYQQYRQQLQAQSAAADNSERYVAKHHNPGVEASNITRDQLAPCELRQRVWIIFKSNEYHFDSLISKLFLTHFCFPLYSIQQAVSLPCTLRKDSDSSCHGSNNCYAWALEIQQIAAKRNGESSAGAIVSKCLSSSTKHDNDDNEALLLNEHTNQAESSASNQVSDQYDEDEIDTPTNPMINGGKCDEKTEEIQSKH